MENINRQCLVVVLNWNGTIDTIECSRSLARNNINYDVLIIDNDSRTDQYEFLQDGLTDLSHNACWEVELSNSKLASEYEIKKGFAYSVNDVNFFLLKSSVNHGFARACNLGAKYAKEKKYEQVLFLNNDTVVEDDFFPYMLEALKTNDAVIPQIRYFHNKKIIWNCGGSISRFGKRDYLFANRSIEDVNLGEKNISITFSTGCALLFRTDYFIDIGMFSEKFFFGEEDIDLSLRLKSLKASVVCVPKSIIYHKVGASLTGDKTKLVRKAYIHYLNRFVNMKNHLGLLWYPWLMPSLMKVFMNVISINKLSLFKAMLFTFKLLVDSLKLNCVDRNKFESTINNGY
ncbi:glycosyltransferase family 2 protein [Erwinia sp. SLM-02]|uniref:glycosyltransferase family 2 protein n=1 Tax=Erwinia sp. SLM-02 TaxID=3020057 RepID=UPI003080520E